MERLQKVLAHAGIASRRQAERLIGEGRVTLNGAVVTRLGTRVDVARDSIKLDGKRIAAPPSRHSYLMLNKPKGVVTTLDDPQGRPTVRDLLDKRGRRVYPVGRLDFQTEGLLLLTDDGELARDLMHPGKNVPKTYLAKVRGEPDRRALERLARGIVIDGRRTRPAKIRTVRPGRNPWIEVVLVEGRNRQVRRMFLTIGHPVLKLRRTGYAGLVLRNLPPGAVRPLTSREVARLRRSVAGPSPVPAKTRPRRPPKRGS